MCKRILNCVSVKVPAIGESITEVTLLKWTKKDGEYVDRDEVIAELESEKATFEVNAEQAGSLKRIAQEGDTLTIGAVLAHIDETAVKPESQLPVASPAKPETGNQQPATTAPITSVPNDIKATPVASAIIADKKVDPTSITPSIVSKRSHLISEMCNKPSLPAINSTKAPNGIIDLTTPSYTSPTSGIATIAFTRLTAASITN